MTRNASIIVRFVENWNAFIIIHVILDFLHFTFYILLQMQLHL